jgi:Helix-turn-helix
MMIVDNEVERYLTLLRNKIREKGFTQLQVQEALSWGRSYISQLLTKQKSLRVEQVLLILDVIGVEPADFFAELYYYPGAAGGGWRSTGGHGQGGHPLAGGFEEMRAMVRGLVWLLIDKEMIDADELTETVKAHKDDPLTDDEPPEEGMTH